MKIFGLVDFLVFVEESEELFFNESYGEIKKIVNENGNGVYSLNYGSRGEVEFKKVNLVDEILEWNELNNDFEFKNIRNDIGNNYLDLCFDEEDFRCYFMIEDFRLGGVK